MAALSLMTASTQVAASRASSREHLDRPGKVGGSIDTERNRVNEGCIYSHAVLQRTQLFESFTALEAAGPQAAEDWSLEGSQRLRGREEPVEIASCNRLEDG